ncbi:MAG: GNAT family N-acetyltransferase [Alphaproteobacteria bacterium]|jgi:ribosomal protein S18 acetylase RimI-like enzyme|nr:GNAT family N-acetyltransferase [Rhodospirillaceae bacterium]MDP6403612.1 GNAT family N-acetyltransferase [Alphaproteobacteria bacterium]MDP6622540.1 GNAT family N-acetyltransferase [Alphaproteobacteria bacterium]
MRIRSATPSDRTAIAAVHTASWQTAYRGTLPDEYLDNKAGDEIRRSWSGIEFSSEDVVLVAEDEQVVGFIAVWCKPDPFIDNLHVFPEQMSKGIGRKLMRAAAQELERLGHSTAYLWVFASNERAIRFYERLGGVRAVLENKDVLGHIIPSFKIEWRDVSVIQNRGD